MKVLVIHDIHLKPAIFDRASELLHEGAADRAVCLMDLPDDWKKEYQIELYEKTFDRAILFVQEHPDTLWCYGNHDLSYVWDCMETGFSPYAISTVNNKLNRLKAGLPSMGQIAFIHRIDNTLFMHGGLTVRFMKLYVETDRWGDVDRMIRSINRLGRDIMWQQESPLWFRPQYSEEEMYGEHEYTQVVGHTPVKEIAKKRNVISCDVFSTYQDGTPIGTCEFAIIDTVTGEFTTRK